ncbi:MAG TPA: hypothetical protein VHC22_12600 [Pirellulales bacterium]|nr:hypothetical protein [Pirellulales bacterium]
MSVRLRLHLLALALLALLVPSDDTRLAADEAPRPREKASQSEDEAPTTRLSLVAAAEPSPALRYRLLPSLLDQRPGNAAVFYNKANLILSQRGDGNKEFEKVDKWLETPLDKLPSEEVRQFIDQHESIFNELRFAIRREECDWQTPLREQMPYAILLPEVQQFRSLARLVALKARLQIAQGNTDEAITSLAMGYAMARHVGSGVTLIQSLVGLAVASIMTNQAQALAERADGPNLYWAYTALPHPFIGLQRANEFEFDMVYLWHPEWRTRHELVYSAAQWQEMWQSLVRSMSELDSGRPNEADQLLVVGFAVGRYGRAKRWLVDQGRAQDEVEAMPVAQVMVLYTLDTYDALRDDLFKWLGLPYWQAYEHLRKHDELLRQASLEREILPLARTVLPAIGGVAFAQARSERSICLARIIEALRLYAAAHEGRLPAQLADVTEVPIPRDPVTGGEFLYSLSGDAAVLATPLPEGLPQQTHGVRYEIKIRR